MSIALRSFILTTRPDRKLRIPTLIKSTQMYENECGVFSVGVITSSSVSSPETARTRGHTEDGRHPGKEAPRWGPQRLGFHRQTPSGGAGARGIGAQGPIRQHLQTEHAGEGQVGRRKSTYLWSCYCWLQERRWSNILFSDSTDVQK